MTTSQSLLQALFFYLPGWMWTEMEGGEVEGVVGEKVTRMMMTVMTVMMTMMTVMTMMTMMTTISIKQQIRNFCLCSFRVFDRWEM